MKFDSRVVHVGDRKRNGAGPVASTVPIHLGTTYFYDSAARLDRVMSNEEPGPSYARFGNPTNQALEELVCDLESGHSATAIASGMAAIQLAVQAALVDRRHSIVASNALYGATIKMFEQVFAAYDVDVSYADACDLEAFGSVIEAHKPGAIFIESISNPLMRVAPIDRIAEMARRAGAALIVDSTFASPLMVRPLEQGAHMVVHSATKYLAGHGDVLGGILITDEEHTPIVQALSRTIGPLLGSFESYLVMRGIKTLALRFQRQCENAHIVAEWLRQHPAIERIYHCSDPEHPDAQTIRRLFPSTLQSAILSFEIRHADRPAVLKFMDSLRMIVPGTSLGDVHSLLLYPVMASHRDLSPKMRERMGIRENLVRLATGIEAAEDIVQDLDQALQSMR